MQHRITTETEKVLAERVRELEADKLRARLAAPRCEHRRQKYFETVLPCLHHGCPEFTRAPSYTIAVRVPSRYPFSIRERDLFDLMAVRIVFEIDRATVAWAPVPCIDRYVDAALTDMLIAAGLKGALLPTAGPSLTFKPKPALDNPPSPSTATTALQAIQARKPPEPWRPSVDEWDLLPDAGQ